MSGNRVIPAEERPQQPGEKQGDPVLTSLPALSPGGAPTRAPHGHTSAGAAPDPMGELPAVALPRRHSHLQPSASGDRQQGGQGAEG